MAQKTVRTGEMARIMGCTEQTIRKWVRTGKIPYHTSPAGQFIFTPEDIQSALGDNNLDSNNRVWAFYTRSSQGRSSALKHQEDALRLHFPDAEYIVKDRASGLNENRKGLRKLFELALDNKITDIAFTTKDRLTRFGYSYLEIFFKTNGVTLHSLNEKKDQSAEEELMSDFMALIASFSGRFYQTRNKRNMKRLLDAANSELEVED